MKHTFRFLLSISMAFMAISCSDVRFKKSDKDICLGDDRNCRLVPETNDLLFDYTESVPYPDNRVDILFVIDNSKSMMNDQQQMANRFYDFMSSISALDWRIAIVTTDTRVGSKEYMDAKLVPFKNGTETVSYVLDKNIPYFETLFKNTIQRQETIDCIYYQTTQPWVCDLNGDERGIYSAIKVLERNEHGFMRAGAPLRIVMISDENERSNGGQYENMRMVPGQDYPKDLVLMANKMGKNLVSYSIIVPSNDSSCLASQQSNSYNDSSFAGTYYEELSNLTGGLVGSVCVSSYTPQLQAISQDIDDGVRDTIKDLACVPKGNTVELFVPSTSASPIVISNVTTKSFTVSPVLQPGTTYRLRYKCEPL